MLAILSLLVGVLPKIVLSWMQAKEGIAASAAQVEIAKREAQAQVLVAETEHWIAWLPRFVLGISAALYTAQVFLSSMVQHPELGPLKLPSDFIYLMSVIIGGYFLDKVVRNFK